MHLCRGGLRRRRVWKDAIDDHPCEKRDERSGDEACEKHERPHPALLWRRILPDCTLARFDPTSGLFSAQLAPHRGADRRALPASKSTTSRRTTSTASSPSAQTTPPRSTASRASRSWRPSANGANLRRCVLRGPPPANYVLTDAASATPLYGVRRRTCRSLHRFQRDPLKLSWPRSSRRPPTAPARRPRRT
jgi:hypothetical protein